MIRANFSLGTGLGFAVMILVSCSAESESMKQLNLKSLVVTESIVKDSGESAGAPGETSASDSHAREDSNQVMLPASVETELKEAVQSAEDVARTFFPGKEFAPVKGSIWRKTIVEIENVVSLFCGEIGDFRKSLGADATTRGLSASRETLMNPLGQGWYAKYLNALSDLQISQSCADGLVAAVRCDADEDAQSCFEKFSDSVLQKLHQSSWSEEKSERYRASFSKVKDEEGLKSALAKTFFASLRSPAFLFRSELGAEKSPGNYELTAQEAQAFRARALGVDFNAESTSKGYQISKEEFRTGQGLSTLVSFYQTSGVQSTLSDLTKSREMFPFFSESVGKAFQAQMEMTLQEVFRVGRASAVRALTTQKLFPAAGLEKFFPESESLNGLRLGFWGLPGVMAGLASEEESKPMTRAKIFLDRVLCADIGFPVDLSSQASVTGNAVEPRTQRERFEALLEVPSCAGCHRLLNPIGLAFESFDAVGQYRESYANGAPVSTFFSLKGFPGLRDGDYPNIASLLHETSVSPRYLQCLVKKAFLEVTGEEPVEKDPLLKDAFIEFMRSEMDLGALFAFLLSDPRVYLRTTGK